MHVAVATVWLYEGLWCKVLGCERRQLQIVEAVPYFGPRVDALFLTTLGVGGIGTGVWVLSGIAPGPCANAKPPRCDKADPGGKTLGPGGS